MRKESEERYYTLMKIGISGAQGTGKTTLARALSEELDLPLVEEQARLLTAREYGYKTPRELHEQTELGQQFQWRCLELQMAAEDKLPGGFISDRTVIDNAVYWMKWHSREAKSEDNMRYYRTVENRARDYDFIIYVPPEISLVANGFRNPDRAYQEEIDFLITLFLTSFVQAYITVAGDLATRVRQVERYLGGVYRNLV
ncbi:MAG: ATP-binding protein [Desulfotomaculaceae bacterium]|nr:ATP-binding protein [Desulfotomaculaceae bacterium]